MQTDTGQTGEEVRNKAEETASVIAREAQETANAQLSTQKERAASTLDSIAQTLRDSGQNIRGDQPQIASLTDEAARRVEDISTYVREHEVRDLVREVENFARREPALFLGGALAIGFLAARFLKASSPSRDTYGQGAYGSYGADRYAGYSWQPTRGTVDEFGGSSIGTTAGTGLGATAGAGVTSDIGVGAGSDFGGGAGVGSTYESPVGAGTASGITGQAYGGTSGYGDTERYGVGADIAAVGSDSDYAGTSGIDTSVDQVEDIGDESTRYDETSR